MKLRGSQINWRKQDTLTQGLWSIQLYASSLQRPELFLKYLLKFVVQAFPADWGLWKQSLLLSFFICMLNCVTWMFTKVNLFSIVTNIITRGYISIVTIILYQDMNIPFFFSGNKTVLLLFSFFVAIGQQKCNAEKWWMWAKKSVFLDSSAGSFIQQHAYTSI